MLSAYSFHPSGAEAITDPERISDLIEGGGTVVWVDAVNPTRDELEKLEDEFDLHPLALEDVANRNQRPKLEVYPSHAFIVLYVHRDGVRPTGYSSSRARACAICCARQSPSVWTI